MLVVVILGASTNTNCVNPLFMRPRIYWDAVSDIDIDKSHPNDTGIGVGLVVSAFVKLAVASVARYRQDTLICIESPGATAMGL